MSRDALHAGLCTDCGQPTFHGPWTDAEIEDAADDIGMPPGDFCDLCDGCFVSQVCAGNLDHAELLLGRKLPGAAKSPIERAAWAILTGSLAA